jgi:hypothetical protein
VGEQELDSLNSALGSRVQQGRIRRVVPRFNIGLVSDEKFGDVDVTGLRCIVKGCLGVVVLCLDLRLAFEKC